MVNNLLFQFLLGDHVREFKERMLLGFLGSSGNDGDAVLDVYIPAASIAFGVQLGDKMTDMS